MAIADRLAKSDAVTLRRNIYWTISGSAVYAACQWGMVLVLARIGSPEMVGQFALGIAVTSPIVLLSQLQLRAVQATDPSGEKYRASDYLALRIWTTGVALAVIAGTIYFSGYRHGTALVVLIVGVAKAAESISDVYYGMAQQREQMARIAKSMVLRSVLSLAALGITVHLTKSVVWGTGAQAVVGLCVLAGYDVGTGWRVLGVRVRPVWDWTILRNLTFHCFPLGLAMMLVSLNVNIPRYFVERHLGERSLGLFAAVASLQGAGTVLINALGQSVSARLAKYYWTQEPEAFFRLLRMLLLSAIAAGVVLVAGAAFAGESILGHLFGPPYASQQQAFLWLSVSAALWYVASILGYAATARSELRFQPWVLVMVVATTTLTCWHLVPKFGVLGAAMASVVPAVLACIGYGRVFRLFHRGLNQ